MFWRILKKDLKRKKTMNVILLLFVIMSAMFASASVNNIVAVNGGIDHYFDEANVPDMAVTIVDENDAEERLSKMSSVSDMRVEHYLPVYSSKFFEFKGKKLDTFVNPALCLPSDEMAINYFDEENKIINTVEKGTFYATAPFLEGLDIKPGESIKLTLGDTSVDLTYKGRFKGALFSSDPSANPFLIINSEDYALLDKEEAAHLMDYKNLYFNTTDPDSITEMADDYDSFNVSTRESLRSIYLYDMFFAYIMMVISIVLMVISFVVLRFSIGFTISEEYREIGVMKAVGIKGSSIRKLYITKYFAISVVGAVIGFFSSVPLSNMMLKTISSNIVFDTDNSIIMGLFSSAAVVLLIQLFCYGCTRRVNKLSPIDAVRSGQTGERFGRKSLLHLGRSKLPATGFLAFNDVLSAPKQFTIITVVLTLCILMIMLLSNFALTLQSDKILFLFDVPESEAHILDSEVMANAILHFENVDGTLADFEKKLADNGMPGKCTMSLCGEAEAEKEGKTAKLVFKAIIGKTDDTLVCSEGRAPRKDNEIAVNTSTLRDLGAQVGDTITADFNGKKHEFMITGVHPAFSTHSVYLNNNYDLSELTLNGSMGLQIHFDNTPDKEQLDRNLEKLEDIFETEKVYSSSGMIKYFTGVSDTLATFKYMMIILTVIVTAMIVILMERSFISKEKSEIALMKAVGTDNGSVIAQHSLRFVIVSAISCVIALSVQMPLSDFLMNKICLLIGDVSNISCAIDPLEIFGICPALLMGVTVIGSLLTALYTNTIKAEDTASIE